MKNVGLPGVVAQACKLRPRGGSGSQIFEFQASLFYVVHSMPAKAM